MAKNKKEFREELTQQFLSLLENEQLNWIKEWSSMTALPFNGSSGKSYAGINRFKLFVTMLQNNWTDPRFMTFNQIKKMKRDDGQGMCSVIKGSKGIQVEYWFLMDRLKAFGQKGKYCTFQEAQKLIDKGLRESSDFQLSARYYTVFNGTQIEGLPEYVQERKRNIDVRRDEIIDKISDSMKVPIEYNDGDQCYYRPSEDKIYLPKPEYFNSQYAFVSTALHELGHSTGAAHRLHRDLVNFFGTEEYAYEELVAEMTSCFISSEIRMPEDNDQEYWDYHIKNHAGYVQSWASVLKNDCNALPKAIKQAEQAADYLEMHAGIISEQEYEKKYSKENHTLTINENNEIKTEQEQVPAMEPVFA